MQKRRIRSRGRLDARIDSARHERSRRCRTRTRTRTCTRATSRKRGSPLRKTEPSMLGVCACSARIFSRMQRARCITQHCVWTRRSRTRTCNRATRKAAHSEGRGGAAEHQQLVVLALHDATAASFAAAALLRCTIGVEISPGPSIARAAGASHQFSCMRLFHLDDEPATTFWPRGRGEQRRRGADRAVALTRRSH